jgi:tRNA-specific 2-thiouridylase
MQVQPRYRCAGQDAVVSPAGAGKHEEGFDVPQRALSPGQICGFYEGEELRGGGIFERIEYSG